MRPVIRDLVVWLLAALLAALTLGCGGGYKSGYPAPQGALADARAVASPPAEPLMEMTELAAEEEAGGFGLFVAGSDDKERIARAPAQPSPRPEPPGDLSPPPGQEGKPLNGHEQPATAGPTPPGPLLIYTAELSLSVFEAAKSIDAVQQLTTDLGGYLVRRDDRSIVVRVPAEKFRETLAQITKLGDVLHREESVRDVTEEFFDLKARLQNMRAVRTRLEQLLAEAQGVEEALAVEKELARVTAEIERMEGKLKLMGELIAFSTITVRFEPRPTDQLDNKVRLPFPWLNNLGLPTLLSL